MLSNRPCEIHAQHVYTNCGRVQLAVVIKMFMLGWIFIQTHSESQTAMSDWRGHKSNTRLVKRDVWIGAQKTRVS